VPGLNPGAVAQAHREFLFHRPTKGLRTAFFQRLSGSDGISPGRDDYF